MTIRTQLAIAVGGKLYPVASFADASRMFCAARDKVEATGSGGASRTPSPMIYAGTKPIAYVAYNGRVFAGAPHEWTPDTRILFETRNHPAAALS